MNMIDMPPNYQTFANDFNFLSRAYLIEEFGTFFNSG